MTSIELSAPAKVNLYLKVLNKRRDSYHNILTIFERISLSDEIKISKIPKGIVVRSNKFITRNPKDNLAYKAARLILGKKKVKNGVSIYIKKEIPLAAGLGGGSSDAAAVLVGINRLFGLGLKKETLMRLARQLGADVPFFILDKSFAIGRKKGDALKAIRSKAVFWHLIIYPGFGVSTKEIYKAFDFTLTQKVADAKIIFPLRYPMDFGTAESMLHNDLEDIVELKKGIIIGKIKERLACILGKYLIVSGSGPSLFCLYRTRKEAVEGEKVLSSSIPAREKKGWRTFVARTC
jgi:4-diphosphocytidyl-2-C-methyl-D-erythritol kinase